MRHQIVIRVHKENIIETTNATDKIRHNVNPCLMRFQVNMLLPFFLRAEKAHAHYIGQTFSGRLILRFCNVL